ncbi:MAG: M48 family metalloprotease [Acidobacteria bacterium]|nr:M48 family metalloprotease [Acidobacteriota bacterium]MBS1865569.1 M48 family metalloprotease [Acidobacteriota bacterium]
MKLTRTTLALLAVALFAQASTAQLGDVFKKVQKAKTIADNNKPWTSEQEQAIGQASAAKLISVFHLYESPDMVKYVNLVGTTVARQSGRSLTYHFGILDTDVVTAVSLPGGYIFITRGALANLKSEAELAGVLAHEVAHVDKRHLEREIRSQKNADFAKTEAASHVPVGGELVNMAGTVVTRSLTMQFSRDKESEADKFGVDYSAKAGYDPAGLRNFLQFLASVPATPQSKQALGLWGSTHPPLGDRINSLNSQLQGFPDPGQKLAERYAWYVNPPAFSRETGAQNAATVPALAPGANEIDGIVMQGVVVLNGAKLPDGTKVKVRPQQ